jgi:NADPH:quinone reductase-like Zn-dependent oxidoreductase
MPNAVVMTGYGPPEVLKWAGVPLPEPGEGQIRIKVKAAGISPTDLALRAGYLKDIPLPPNAVLGFEAAGTVDAVGPGVSGASAGDAVTALLFSLGGYAEYAVASIWTGCGSSRLLLRTGQRSSRGPRRCRSDCWSCSTSTR